MLRPLIAGGLILAALAAPASATAGATASVGAFPNETGGAAVLQQHLGTTLGIDSHYVPWDFTSWAKKIAPDKTDGSTPMLSWSAAPLTTASAIAAGSQDARITAAAKALKAEGVTIYLRPFYEFDQPKGHPRYIGTSTELIAAWRHTRSIFRSVGATNVKFVWCPMSFDYASGVAQKFWPGAGYVDYVAADGYNFPGRKWRAFGEIFDAAYSFSVAQGRPFYIAETASPGNDPRTPSWISGAAQWVAQSPNVAAVVYFDSVSPKGYDFRLYAHPATFTAYKSWLNHS
jgi:hypothetical protein